MSAHPVRHLQRSRPMIRRLEPRMMFDGAAADVVADAAVTELALPDAAHLLADAAAPAAVVHTTTENARATTAEAPSRDEVGATVAAALLPVSSDPAHQLIVVDASVPDADAFVAGVAPGWTVLRLSAERDGLTQLQELLAGRQDLQAIHIFSHGSAGRITLGNLELSTETMSQRQAELAAIGAHLAEQGDLMLYGCNVGADFAGQAFVNQLARTTGADVAASSDATGNALLGGNWVLETGTGPIDTAALSASAYDALLADLRMSVGEASDSIAFSSNRYSPRLYWQASGAGGYGNTGDTAWVDQYTSNQLVKYWGTEWHSFTYPVFRWGWLPWTVETAWYQVPAAKDWNYGSGARYATMQVTLDADSLYQFDVTANQVYKDRQGQVVNAGPYALNTALYRGGFDPTNPLRNLVTASEGGLLSGGAVKTGSQLQQGELAAGTYTVVVSFDTLRWLVSRDDNVWWSDANTYAQQLWGNFTLNVQNLNRAPVWTTRNLDLTLDGAGDKPFSIPPAVGTDTTVRDPDGDDFTVTAQMVVGGVAQALPSWMSFDAATLRFSGNPPANTGTVTLRLTADDGQARSTRDFAVTYTNDNDQPVLVTPLPDLVWNGAGAFSAVLGPQFTDADPGVDSYTWSATLADGSALPAWLQFDPASGTLSGNPPNGAAPLDIRITANDGSGQANATQSDVFRLALSNSNDTPTVSDVARSMAEDTVLSFSLADFNFSDTDTHAADGSTAGPGRTLQSVRILGLPTHGTLWLDTDNDETLDAGEAVAVNQLLTAASLARLRYTPAPDWAGGATLNLSNAPDSFTWTASDGVQEAATPATTRITVTLVNDAPVLDLSDGRALIIRPNTGQALNTPALVDPALLLVDADAALTSNMAFDTIYSASVSVVDKTTGNFQAGDVLAATATGGISVAYNAATGVMTLSGPANVGARAADYQAVLRTLRFSSIDTTNDNVREVNVLLRTADVGSMTAPVFDGVDDYVDTQRGSIPLAGDYTLSVLARLDAASVADGAQHTIVSQGVSGNNFFIQLNRVGSNYNLRLGDGWTVTNAFPMDGKWHQYTVVKSGEGASNGTLYIDGVRVATGTLGRVEGTGLRIGRLYRSSDTVDFTGYWQGAISDLRIYDRTLKASEVIASLDRGNALTGYEPNLLAWYPLVTDFDNRALTTFDLGRDYNPANSSVAQGPWSLGIVTGDPAATGNFAATSFQAMNAETLLAAANDKFVQLDHRYFGFDKANGWARFLLPNNTAERYTSGTLSLDPGAVTVLPGFANPGAMQFSAPVAGVYAVDARFWSAFSDKSSSWPTYKVFRVAANGTMTELSGAGGAVSSTGAATANRSGLQQVVLLAGEKLVFAFHKGDANAVGNDEVSTLIRLDLLAVRTAAGSYYSLEDGHHYGITSSTSNSWDTARTAAAALSVDGVAGYLSIPNSAATMRIAAALTQRAGDDAGVVANISNDYAWAGFRQVSTTQEPAGGWFWVTGPEANQPFDAAWAAGEPNNAGGTEHYGAIYRTGNFNDLASGGSTAYRSLVEYGSTRLALPPELAALSASPDRGNALVYQDAGIAWSARTGHYYQLGATSGDYPTAQAAAPTYAGQTGYLSRLTSLNEADLAAWLVRSGAASGAWVGLQRSDPNGNSQFVYRWTSGAAPATDYSQGQVRSEVPAAANGQTLISYEDFQTTSRSGWVFDGTSNPVGVTDDGSGRGNQVLGYNAGGWVYKNYEIDNRATTVSFVFNRVDSWDVGESLSLRLRSSADNYAAYDEITLGLSHTVNYSGTLTPSFVSTRSGTPVSLANFSVTALPNYGNFTGLSTGNWTDQSFRITFTLPQNYGDALRLYLGTNLDGGTNDESWTVDNVALTQATAVGVNSNATLGGTLDTFTDGAAGWDNNALDGGSTPSSRWTAVTTVNGSQALHFTSGNPTKTFQIDNQATRVAFDLYTLDSWDGESFSAHINRSQVFSFTRTSTTQITGTMTGTAMVGGKVVGYTITPGSYGNFYTDDPAQTANDQAFRVVLDLPEDFGSSFELTFDNTLDEPHTNERAAIDNVQVTSLDNTGWIDARGIVGLDSNAATSPMRLDQFRSVNLVDGGGAMDDGDPDIVGLATDGRFIYTYEVANNRINVFNMTGVKQRDFAVSSATLGVEQVEMAISGGYLYIRNNGPTATAINSNPASATDDTVWRVSTVDGSTTAVTLDSSRPLLGGAGYISGSLFNMPDGRLGIVSTVPSSGATTVRLYHLADNGTRLVWERDYTLNVGAGWLNDNHGATSDGKHLYILRNVLTNSDVEYKVFDLASGALVVDGASANLVQQSVNNPTFLARDPLTGDLYFADYAGSHLAHVLQPTSAQRVPLFEYGPEGAALPAPLLTTSVAALPDRFVSDARNVQIRVGNVAPTVGNWSASGTEDAAFAFTRAQFEATFSDPDLDGLYSITLQSLPAGGSLMLNGVALANGAQVFAGDLDRLTFVPTADFNGALSFGYRASDGQLTSSGTATVSLTLAPLNDAPVLDVAGAPVLPAIVEDVLAAANLGSTVADLVLNGAITDVDLTPPSSAPEAIAVTRVDNTYGRWQYDSGSGWTDFSATTGTLVNLGAAARLLDSSHRIRFVPDANASGTAQIYYRAWDRTAGSAGGTTDPFAAGGNLTLSVAEEVATLTVTPVNDAPTTAPVTLSMDEDSSHVFAATDFVFADIDTGNSLQALRIASLPVAGTLTLSGVAVTATQVVTRADLDAGLLRFTPAPDVFGPAYASFDVAVGDGTDFSAPAAITIDVLDANDAPTAIAWTPGNLAAGQPHGSVAENSAAETVVGRLLGTDPDSGDVLRFARVGSSPFNVAPDGTVTVGSGADLDFERQPTWTLRVRVTDSRGVSYEQDVTINLLDVLEQAPQLVVNPLYIPKGDTQTIGETNLKAVDAQQTPGQLVYTVNEAGSGGTWWLDANGNNVQDEGEALAPVNEANPDGRDTFTHQDVLDGRLHFTQDGTQTNSKLALSVSDGTDTVADTLVAIVSSPPVLSPVPDQQWAVSGAQTLRLPPNTYTDADMDTVAVTATLADGSPLPAWLMFDAATWTFSGTPAGVVHGDAITIRLSGTDGRHAPVTDAFVLAFSNTITRPAVSTPIPDQVFDGAGSHAYQVPAGTFTAQSGHPISGYTAAQADGSALPAWLSFNAATRTFSGNPPEGAVPGPYWIRVTAQTASGGSATSDFRLIVANANDIPAASGVALPNRVISDDQSHVYAVDRGVFVDGDLDLVTLRAGDADGNPLPNWVRFTFDAATGQGQFTAKAPAGSGVLAVRLFADDGQGGTGWRDFTITYSGGRNEAPRVMTSAGIWGMDQDQPPQLFVADAQKAELFSIAQGGSATITDRHLVEADPDDDGAGLAYTLRSGPTHGELWLDLDGDGLLGAGENALAVGNSFTQADVAAQRLRYRDTNAADNGASATVADSFLFDLADGGENGALPVTGARFDIQVTPRPATPTLMQVLRSAPLNETTNADTLAFEVRFSESVRGVDASDFIATGALAGSAVVQGVSQVDGRTYTVIVGGAGLANANGALGLALRPGFGISDRTGTVAADPAQRTGLVLQQGYVLDNLGPVAVVQAPALHDGSTAFWVTLEFGPDAVNDFTLADLTAGNATLSDLQRISSDPAVDPDTPPAGFDPAVRDVTLQGNLYRVLVTPTAANQPIVLNLVGAGVTDTAGNATAPAGATVAFDTAPSVTLHPAGPTVDRSATFTERDGADDGSSAVAFSTAGISIADADGSSTLAALTVRIADAQIADGAAETLRVQGATAGAEIALDVVDGAGIADVVLGTTSYRVTASVAAGVRSLAFSRSGGGLLSMAQAEALLDALRYNHAGDTPTAGNRVFEVLASDGANQGPAARFTVTVQPTNDTPQVTVGAGDAAGAALAEANTGLTASGTLGVQDRDLGDALTAAVLGVASTDGGGSPVTVPGLSNAAVQAMLGLDAGNLLPAGSTNGTLHWRFDSAGQAFDHLAAGEVLRLVYTLRISDDGSPVRSADQAVVVTITGSNDAPAITSVALQTLDNSGTPLTASGSIGFADADASDLPVGSYTTGAGNPQVTAERAGGGGTFALDAAALTALQQALAAGASTGNPGSVGWNYAVDPAALRDDTGTLIALGDKITAVYDVVVDDGHGGSATQSLKFVVVGTGTGGALTVLGDAGTIVEGAPATLSDAGALSFGGNVVSVAVSTVSVTAGFTLVSTDQAAIEAAFSATQAGAATAVSWVYAITEAELDFLQAGDVVTAVFDVTATLADTSTATERVTIVIGGTNDAPVVTSAATAEQGSVVEAGASVAGTPTATGTLSASDVDRDHVLDWQVQDDSGAPAWGLGATGSYGDIALNATTGQWTYTLDDTRAATQALASGQSAVEHFAVRVRDEQGAATLRTISITVVGSADAPVLAAPGLVATYTDTAADDSVTDTTGTLSATDVDAGITRSYAITGQVGDNRVAGYSHSLDGDYGTLHLNAATGAWLYRPDPVRMNAATVAGLSDSFTLTATNAGGVVSNTVTLQVALDGVNDDPTLVANPGGAAASLQAGTTGLTATGSLLAGERDLAQGLTAQITGGTVSLNSATATAMGTAQLGWLSLATSSLLANTTDLDEDLVWNFDSGAETFAALEPSDQLRLVYTVRVDDGTAQAERTVSIAIGGLNDVPQLTLGAGDSDSAALTEGAASPLTASGTLSAADADASDTLTASVTTVALGGTAPAGARPSNAALLAMLQVQPTTLLADASATSAPNGLQWVFDAGSEAFDGLADGETLVLTYTVQVSDGLADATRSVTVTLTGTNDAPAITGGGTTGAIASGQSGPLSASGALQFADPDRADRPTAGELPVSVVGTAAGGAPGSLVLTAGQVSAIQAGFSLLPAPGGNTHQGSVPWQYAITQAALDFLAPGASVAAVFRITVSDGQGGAVEQDVTITLSGPNEAPRITEGAGDAATAALTEGDAPLAVGGTLTVQDIDLGDAVTASVSGGSMRQGAGAVQPMDAAALAWLQLSPAPVLAPGRSAADARLAWRFDSGAEAFDYLAAGETLELQYTLTVRDDAPVPGSDSLVLRLTITGTNDAPTVDAALLREATAGDAAFTLDLLAGARDPDTQDTLQAAQLRFSVDGGTAATSTPPGLRLQGNSLEVDPADPAFATLLRGQTQTIEVRFQVQDASGALVEQTLTLTVRGRAEPPVVDPGEGASVSLVETDAGLASAGTLRVTGLDAGRPLTARAIAVAPQGVHDGLSSSTDALLAMLNVEPAMDAQGRLAWRFASGTEAFDYLAAGETLDLLFTVRVSDGQHDADQQVRVRIQGSNDAPQAAGAAPAAQDTTVGAAFAWTLPDGSFSDRDRSDVLVYSARLADGAPLPGWLQFDAATRTLSGLPPDDAQAGSWQIQLTATDPWGASAAVELRLQVRPKSDSGNPPTPEPPPPAPPAQPPAAEPVPAPSVAPPPHVAEPSEAPAPGVSPPGWTPPAWSPSVLGAAALAEGSDLLSARGLADSAYRIVGPGSLAWSLDTRALQGETLVVQAPLRDLCVASGARVSLTLPADAFVHSNPQAVLALSAQLADGRPLPPWLVFHPQGGRFEGVPPPNLRGVLQLRVTARDAAGLEAVHLLRIVVGQGDAGVPDAGICTPSGLAPLERLPGEGDRPTADAAQAAPAVARAGLSELFRQAGRDRLPARLAALSRSVQAAERLRG